MSTASTNDELVTREPVYAMRLMHNAISENEQSAAQFKSIVVVHRSRFGTAVKSARKKHNISLRALGVEIGVSHSFLHDLECGRRWSDDVAQKLLDYFNAKTYATERTTTAEASCDTER